jgi:hypothetical protein
MNALAAFAIALTLAVPTPKDAKETEPVAAPTGPAPRLLFVKADADGKIRIAAQTQGVGGVMAVQIQIGGAGVPGAPGGAQVVQRAVGGLGPVELGKLKDLSITTISGTKVDVDEATKRLATGGFVLQSTDGKAIDPSWLRLFRVDGILVLTSPDLVVGTAGGVQIFNVGGAGGIGGAVPLPVAPVPAPAPKKE